MQPPSLKLTHKLTGVTATVSGHYPEEVLRQKALKIIRAKLYELENPTGSHDIMIEHGDGSDIELIIKMCRDNKSVTI